MKPTVLIATTSRLVSDCSTGDGFGQGWLHSGCCLSCRDIHLQHERGARRLILTGA